MNDKCNHFCLKKKDLIVIFVNLSVLTFVIYIYYIVENLKAMLSNENLCTNHDSLTTHPKVDLTKFNMDATHFPQYKMIDQHSNVRHIRSINSVKFQNSSLFFLAQPNKDFEQNGILGPWILSNKGLSADTYAPIKLTSRRTLLEFVDGGLYLVYIQVYYLSSSKRNSFTMTKITAGVNETLSVCSAVGVYGTEISCFTSTVEYFKTGESILIRLREMSPGLNLSRKISETYLGLIKLL